MISVFLASTAIFYLSRYYFGNYLQKVYKKKLKKINENLDKNEFYYLLILRFSILFPFFLIGIFAGISKISYFKFAISTIIGSIPGAILYTYIGYQFRISNTIMEIFNFEIILILLFLIFLSSIPVLYNIFSKKTWKKNI